MCPDVTLRASRRGLVPPFIAMDVLRAANEREAAGADVIHLEVGQPGTSAPEAVLEAARRALVDERIGYTDALGIAPLREAIAGHYQAQYGVAVDPAEIVVTTGSSAAFQLAFLAAFEPGDRVGARCPGLPRLSQHPVGARHRAGADRSRRERPLPADPRAARRFGRSRRADHRQPGQPDRHDDRAAELARLADYCRDRGIRLVSDEIYHGITYESAAATARAFGREAIIVNSFSKYYSMTGWRLGWMLVPPDLARSVECLAQNFYISPPALSQLAALAVFDCRAELDGHVARYRANRDLLIRTLSAAGSHPLRAGRRRVLPLCRHLEPDARQREFLPASPRRDWGRGDPGPRFRPDPWRRLGAVLVRRLDRGRRRGGAPPHGVAGKDWLKTTACMIRPAGR